MEEAGFLVRDAPLSTDVVVDHMAVFYQLVREPGPLTITPDYASAVVRRFFDLRSPVSNYVAIPRSYVILQRINLGLFALLGELNATANWRTDRRGDLAIRPGPRLHPDRRGRGSLAGEAVSGHARCGGSLLRRRDARRRRSSWRTSPPWRRSRGRRAACPCLPAQRRRTERGRRHTRLESTGMHPGSRARETSGAGYGAR